MKRKNFLKLGASAAITATGTLALSSCSGSSGGGDAGDGPVTLTLAQWWQPEAGGALEELVAAFEDANPDITIELQTGPYGNTKDLYLTGAAAGTLPDILGLDPNWVYDLTKQGVLADLGTLDSAANTSLIDSIEGVVVDDATRALNLAYAAYVLFVNTDALATVGADVPTTWEEFRETAEAIHAANPEMAGTVLPLALESPVSIKNDMLSWFWAGGGSFRDGAGADLVDPELEEVMAYFADLNAAGLIAPGIANMTEQDKVGAFSTGQSAMMVSATPHIPLVRDASQAEFTVAAIPTPDGFNGTPRATYGSWAVGVAETSPNKTAAWKFVEFLLSAEENAPLAAAANLFPSNPESELDASAMDENGAAAYEVWKSGTPVDEFLGLPSANELQRTLIEQVHQILTGDIDPAGGLEAAQAEWDSIIGTD